MIGSRSLPNVGPPVVATAFFIIATGASAQVAGPKPDEQSQAAPPPLGTSPEVTPVGYVEAYYAYNFNRPSNGITNFRGFDNRHNTFSLSNAAIGANFEAGPIGGRLILQVGSTPSTYYRGEPALAGAAVGPSGAELWRHLQEAFVTYKAPVRRKLQLQLGLFASPIGLEVFAVKDNWNWSRSNLFFGLPFYHTGLRVTFELTDELSATAGVFNGWNSVVDNNEEKSLQANLTYRTGDGLLIQALYFGGVERPRGSPEGSPFRHHFDAFGQYDATGWLSLAGQADYGWESTRMGRTHWVAAALYARIEPMNRVYIAFRGDRFHESLAEGSAGTSSAVFWNGIEWVSSGTVTLDLRPHDQMSIRLEYRHDAASGPLYFERDVRGDGGAAPYIANVTTQDTAVLGATAWF
jgi:hypothetical protein